MMGNDGSLRVKLQRCLPCDLFSEGKALKRPISHVEIPYLGLGFRNVLFLKEELPIQICQINRIQVNNINLPETGHDQVLQNFTTDSPGPHQKDPGIFYPFQVLDS
jgi:hypothetical protein